jgi:Family of unknown function (DUF6496)
MMSDGGSTSDDDDSTQKDAPSGADDPTTTAYKVQHYFDPSPAPSPAPTDKSVESGFWAGGGEVTSDDDDDDDSDLTDVDTDMSHVPKDSPLRMKTEMDSYAEGGKVAKTMREFSKGELHSGSKHGPLVTDRKQALAIGESEERNMDEGGEVLDDAMGEELMDAIHKKDKKGIMSAMRAIAMSCKNKED